MFVHCANPARAHSDSALQLGTAIDEAADCPLEGYFRGRPVGESTAWNQLIECCAAMRHNQRKAARSRFRGNHAEGFGLTAMNQCVGACEKARKLGTVGYAGKHCNASDPLCELLQSRTLCAIADEQQADWPLASRFRDSAHHHVPALLGGESPYADKQGRIGIKAKRSESLLAHYGGPKRRRENARFNSHWKSFAIGNAAPTQTLGEIGIGADDTVEHPPKASQVTPEPAEQLVDAIGRNEAAEPPISICGKRIGMHD